MSTRSHVRLVVLHVLVLSLLTALVGRLWYLQILSGDRIEQAAAETRSRDVLLPALRGEIYDSTGRPLVENEGRLVVSVSRSELSRLPDDGEAVLHRLADVLPGESYDSLSKQLRLCSTGVEQPCWNGSPYQPVPVADSVSPKIALQIMERKADFPGVFARPSAVRSYPSPGGADAAHVVGHLSPITQQQYEARKEKQKRLTPASLVGGDGLEATYEKYLRGTPGVENVVVDSKGRVTGTTRTTPPVPGSHLVTSINAMVQQDVEQAIKDAMERARNNGEPAEAAAGVVLDVRTGRVIAMASAPTFDPSVWVGGISQQQYARLSSEEANQPMINRATQGQYPVGSTFKPISLSAAVKAGFSLNGTYPCPGGYQVGNRVWHNYESRSYGMIDLHRSLVISCDTVYYRFAHLLWQRQGGEDQKSVGDTTEPIPHMAKEYGLAAKTGIDLPTESDGRIPDPGWKMEYWKETKDHYCKYAKEGYPDVAKDDPSRAKYLEKLATEQCKRGYVWRAGDAVNLSIGQGDMLATPLQLARAYAAIANGGTLYTPRIGKAIVRPDGTVVEKITPPKAGQVSVSNKVLRYIRKALADVPRSGTAAGTFAGFPLDRFPIAGKTGTAQAYGEEDTAWFASFAPADDPRYAVVVTVSQGGLGSSAAAPAVRDIYEGIFGVGKQKPALPDGPPDELPDVTNGISEPPRGNTKSPGTPADSPDTSGSTEVAAAPVQQAGPTLTPTATPVALPAMTSSYVSRVPRHRAVRRMRRPLPGTRPARPGVRSAQGSLEKLLGRRRR